MPIDSETRDSEAQVSGPANVADRVRQRAASAVEAARERAATAYASTRENAALAGKRTTESLDANPVAALVGGFAIGALVAGLLPRTRRETEVLGGVGGRINETAREAAYAARDAGREKLDEYGLNRDGISEKINELAQNASAALRSSSASRRRGD